MNANNYRIYLFVNNLWQELEILNDIDIKTTYQIFNVDELFKKQGDYTIDFDIVGSKTNDRIFKYAYNISTFDSFAFNSPVPARIYRNDVEILIGQLELLNITKNNKTTIYKVVAYSQIRSLVNALGDYYLIGNANDGNYAGGYIESGYTFLGENDIDVTRDNHELSIANIENSWITGQTLSYVYPLIDDGNLNYTGNTFKANHFTPALYVKYVFDKIIEDAGFTYESQFLNSDLFKKLIMTSCVAQFKPNNITSEKFKITAEGNTSGYSSYPGISGTTILKDNFSDDYFSDSVDWKFTKAMATAEGVLVNQHYWSNGGATTIPLPLYSVQSPYHTIHQYSTIQGNHYTRFVINKTGKYDIKVNINFSNAFLYSDSWPSIVFGGLSWGDVQFKATLGMWYKQYDSSGVLKTKYLMKGPLDGSNHTWYPNQYTAGGSLEPQFSDTRRLYSFDESLDGWKMKVDDTQYTINCVAGDYIQFEFELFSVDYGVTTENEGFKTPFKQAFSYYDFFDLWWKFQIDNESSFELTLPDLQSSDFLSESDYIDLSNCLPTKCKKIDFIRSIFNMFNLYILDDPNIENNLIIETRDVIMSSGKIVDWTNKLDNDKDIKISQVSDILSKKLNFSYKEDVDDISKAYFDIYDVTYGGYKRLEKYYKSSDNEEQKTELIFGSPCIVSHGNYPYHINVLEIKNIEYDNTAVPPTSKVIYNIYNPRILFYNGFNPKTHFGRTMFSILSDIDGIHSYGRWPDFNHINGNSGSENNDLCFFYNYHYYQYLSGNTIQGNLFNRYYSKTINEYEDSDAKRINAFFFISESDRYNLNLFDIIQIDHPDETSLHYRISKIINFDPTTSTEVELIKFNDLNLYYTPPPLINGMNSLNKGNDFTSLTTWYNNVNNSLTSLTYDTSVLNTEISANTYVLNQISWLSASTCINSGTCVQINNMQQDCDHTRFLSAITFVATPSATYEFTQNINASMVFCDFVNISGISFGFSGGKFPSSGTTSMGFFGVKPINKPSPLSASEPTISGHSYGSEPKYDWIATQSLINNWGFQDQDSFITMTNVVKNLQDRINELEQKLKNLGLLS